MKEIRPELLTIIVALTTGIASLPDPDACPVAEGEVRVVICLSYENPTDLQVVLNGGIVNGRHTLRAFPPHEKLMLPVYFTGEQQERSILVEDLQGVLLGIVHVATNGTLTTEEPPSSSSENTQK